MAFLKADDYKKESSSGDYAGSSRADCIRYMIRDKKPFYLTKNGTGKPVYGVMVDFPSGDNKAGELYYVLKESELRKKNKKPLIVKTNKVYKSPEMGGGSGSGAGARATEIQECMQCYVSSYQFNVAKKTLSVLPTPAQLKKSNVTSYVDASATIDECLEEITDAWIKEKQYVRIANILYDHAKNKFSGKVYFHRGSRFMNKIYGAKKKVMRLDKQSKKPQAPGSFSDDKWNPGDIWMSTLSKTQDPFGACTSWGELKVAVQEAADSGECLGVSLKKLGKSGGKIQEYNRTPLPDTAWYDWSWGKTGEFFKSIDIYVTVNGVQIQFRNFNKTKSWQGEIKGSSAAGGKIGGGNVNFYLEEQGLNSLYRSEDNFISSLRKKEDMTDYLWQGYQRHNKNSKPSKALMSYEEFVSELNQQDQGFKNSKAICIAFLDSVYSGQKNKRDNLATAMFNYGSSATEQSSYFIKIS